MIKETKHLIISELDRDYAKEQYDIILSQCKTLPITFEISAIGEDIDGDLDYNLDYFVTFAGKDYYLDDQPAYREEANEIAIEALQQSTAEAGLNDEYLANCV